MSWIRRVLAAVIVALLLALGSQPAHAASAPADSDLVHGYVYDAHVIPNVVTNGALERGPPANLATCTSAPAVDLGSYGRFARPDGGTPAVIYTYDGTACRAQAGDSWGTGAEVAQGSYGELSALRLAGVAAKSAPEAAAALKGPIADQVARNLPQQLALGAARDGQGAIIMRNLGDAPRLVANYGEGNWVKMQYVLRGNDSNVTVHYFRNLTTKMDVEFKFK